MAQQKASSEIIIDRLRRINKKLWPNPSTSAAGYAKLRNGVGAVGIQALLWLDANLPDVVPPTIIEGQAEKILGDFPRLNELTDPKRLLAEHRPYVLTEAQLFEFCDRFPEKATQLAGCIDGLHGVYRPQLAEWVDGIVRQFNPLSKRPSPGLDL